MRPESRRDGARLVEWIRATAERDFRDEIALVLVYGSYVTGDARPNSDVDCFFIPRTPRGATFARTFIIGGIGYDIFPMGWERVERIADLEDHLTPLLADSVVLFAGTPDDEARLLRLRARLREHLADRDHMHATAVRAFRRAETARGRAADATDPCRVLTDTGLALLGLAEAVAYANGTYFRRGIRGLVADLRGLPAVPDGFVRDFLGVVGTTDPGEARARLGALVARTAAFLGVDLEPVVAGGGDAGHAVVPDFRALAGLYEEISSSFGKVEANCAAGDPVMAFLNAVMLQECLDDELRGSGVDLRLVDAHDPADLAGLRERARGVEATLVRFIESGGGTITRHPDIEAFLAEQAGAVPPDRV